MVRKIEKAILITLTFLLTLTACSSSKNENYKPFNGVENGTQREALKNMNQYDINIEFYPEEKVIRGEQRVTYINNEDIPIDKIYFHLYPNAFKTKETAPFLFDNFMSAYPRGFSEGYIDIDKIYVDGSEGEYSIGEFGITIMEIILPYRLDIGDRVYIDMQYTIKLPPAVERFGYGSDTYNLGNWYPIASVYDEEGWNLDPYYPIGDPFYTDASNYKVNIRTPKDFTVASTGNILSRELVDDIIEWEIEANAVRDFAWVASKNFEVVEEEVDGTLIKMYFLKDGMENGEIRNRALEFTKKSLKTFNKVFGEYPYKQYSVVQTNFPSAMEYSGIVFIGSRYYDKAFTDFLEILIVHETAHQWWYGVVGNDQIDQAWLDESFASYSEVIYMAENYGEKAGETYHRIKNEEDFHRSVDSLQDKVILKTLKDFENWNDYGLLVYTKGAIFLDDISDKYGKEIFYKILQTYYDRYKFKIATTEDFIEICEEVTGEDLDDYFENWLKNGS